MGNNVELKLTGFKELQDKLSPGKFPARLRRHVRKASKLIGLIAEGEVKEKINAGGPYGEIAAAQNAPLTKKLKGSSRPLVDSGELVKSINSKVTAWDEVTVGVLKDRTVNEPDTGTQKPIKSIAAIVHEGGVADVTPRMRGFFAMMADKFEKGEVKRPWRPLRATTTVIVIPARPFMKSAVAKKMSARYHVIWGDAIQRALSGVK